MSTKTTFKRIALVAVAALGFGMVSTVSASAATGEITLTAGTNTGDATAAVVATTAGANNFISFTLDTADSYAVAVTGGTAVSSATNVTGSGTATLVAQDNNSTTAFTIPTPTVGTIVVKTYLFTGGVQAATSTSSLTITVAAAATGVGVLSVGNSKSYITESATIGGITSFASTPALSKANAATALAALSIDDATAVTKGTAGSPAIAAVIVGVLKDSQVPSAAAMAGKTLTATITGSGLLTGSATTDAALGTTPARVATAVTGTTTAGAWAFGVYSDGSAGVGTITVSYTDALNVTTVIATKTITFYGAAASFTATTKTKYIANSGSAWPENATSAGATAGLGSTYYAVKIVVKDSAGNPVGGVTPTAKIAAADQIYVSSGTCTASTYTSGSSYCSLTGVSGAADANVTVTFYTGATTTFNYVSVDVPVVVVSQKAATFVVTGDAEVAAGGLITYTITAKDAAGNPIADGRLVTDYLYASPTIAGGALTDYAAASANAVGALFTGVKFYNGVATDTVQAPFGTTTVSADFYGNGALVATTGGSYFATAALRNFNTVVETKVALDNSTAQAAADAAAEATDAANAATDAANAAAEAADAATAAAQDAADAVAALSTQVAEMVSALKKQITALTNLVIKIQKKVKA